MKPLKTERLSLRVPDHGDADFFLELLNDRSFIDNIADRGVRTREDACAYIDRLRKGFADHGTGFSLVESHSGEKLGMCGIIYRDTLPEPDLGFAFLPRHTGNGYAFEASTAVLKEAFRDFKLFRIAAIVSPGNLRSEKLLLKLGFQKGRRIRHGEDSSPVDYYVVSREGMGRGRNRLEALFHQSSVAIQIYDRSGYCIDVNDAWEKVFHSRKADLEGYNVLEDPQIKETGVLIHFKRAFAGHVVHVPATYYDPKLSGNDGRGRWLEAIFSPVRDGEGSVVEVAILFLDITDRMESQFAEARTLEQMRIVFDHLPEGVIVEDTDFNIVYANPTAIQMAGYKSLDDWLLEHPASSNYTIHTLDGSPFPVDELPSRIALSGSDEIPEVQMLVRYLNPPKEVYSSVASRPILDEDGKVRQIVTVFRDITEKILIDQALRDALEVKDLFFSVASHELRTPLTALSLTAKVLRYNQPNLPEDALDRLERQIGKLTRHVDEMLDFSRLTRGLLDIDPVDLDLVKLVGGVLKEYGDQFSLAGIDVRFEAPAKIQGRWDAARLEQALENLFTNVIRYAPGAPMEVKISHDSETVFIEVSDQGPGIPSEDLERIFYRFERSRFFGERNGLGLGLFITKEIVALHGGKISASNLNIGGARFLIELPRSECR